MNGIVETAQKALEYVCLAGLAVCIVSLFVMKTKALYGDLIDRFIVEFHRNKGVLLTVPMVVACIMYGGSKGGGPSYRSGVTADSDIGLVGLIAETNAVPDTVVSVYYTSGLVTASTPVSVRNLQTEAWTELVKTDCQYDSVGTTNVFQFVVAGTNYLDSAYWHVGSSKPPIVVTSSDINIETIVTSANFVYLKWNCTDANCTSFSVMTSEDGSSWSLAGTTSNKEFTVSGFLVGRTRWWKITSSYFREEEE